MEVLSSSLGVSAELLHDPTPAIAPTKPDYCPSPQDFECAICQGIVVDPVVVSCTPLNAIAS